ncbi:hypothetical protein RR46_00225 [Papilio xuthus]|uniref:Uncharacterized protein n=1 Tax=Papilio xuthus TaxID=66420 RepID=A0A0N0PF09_PAPXU|nr:hypothetical protein RR46_00225 [Papilio xuthus]
MDVEFVKGSRASNGSHVLRRKASMKNRFNLVIRVDSTVVGSRGSRNGRVESLTLFAVADARPERRSPPAAPRIEASGLSTRARAFALAAAPSPFPPPTPRSRIALPAATPCRLRLRPDLSDQLSNLRITNDVRAILTLVPRRPG